MEEKPLTFFFSLLCSERWNSNNNNGDDDSFWRAASVHEICHRRNICAQKMGRDTGDIPAEGKAEEGVVQNYRLLCSSTTDNTKEWGEKSMGLSFLQPSTASYEIPPPLFIGSVLPLLFFIIIKSIPKFMNPCPLFYSCALKDVVVIRYNIILKKENFVFLSFIDVIIRYYIMQCVCCRAGGWGFVFTRFALGGFMSDDRARHKTAAAAYYIHQYNVSNEWISSTIIRNLLHHLPALHIHLLMMPETRGQYSLRKDKRGRNKLNNSNVIITWAITYFKKKK